MVSALPLRSVDVVLHPGKTVELPEDVDAVMTLAAKGLLIAVDSGQLTVDSEDIPLDPPSKGDLKDGAAGGGRKSK